MKASALRLALLVSLTINLGVALAVAVDALRAREPMPALAEHLALDAGQQARWQASEGPFLAQFSAAAARIEAHRAALVRAILAEVPDAEAIERERAAIARLQQAQQRLMIEQLLAEREILDAVQRARLAQLLLEQPGVASAIEELHRR